MFQLDTSLGYSQLEEIILNNGVTEIKSYVLENHSNLKKITLPVTLTKIGSYAFRGATSLEKIGVDPDHQEASLVIPDSVAIISDSTFYRCTGLTSAVIPSSVQEIGQSAFAYTSLTSVKLNEGLKTIGQYAFAHTKLTEVEIPSSVTSYYVPPNSSSQDLNIFWQVPLKKMTIGGGITTIPLYMFQLDTSLSHSQLEEIILNNGVTEIKTSALQNQINLKKITLPVTLTTIGTQAFRGATSLATVVTGPNLSSIGSNAFASTHPVFYALPGTERNEWLSAWCQENGFVYAPDQPVMIQVCFDDGLEDTEDILTEVETYGLLPEPDAPQRDGWSFLGWFRQGDTEPWNFSDDHAGATDLTLTARWQKETVNGLYRTENGEATLVSYAIADGDSTIVAIPPSWQGYPVTAIADGAFAGEPVTVITLPATITSLSRGAFEGADDLYRINVQSMNTSFSSVNGILYSADKSTLYYCPAGMNLTSFTVPETVSTIAGYAFAGHEELVSVAFPQGLSQIGDYAFSNCGITRLTLPDGLGSIGEGAFQGCSDLETAEGAAQCLHIGNNAFASTGFCIFYGAEGSALVSYAETNGKPYNIYTVSYYLDGESAAQSRMKAGEAVPRKNVAAPACRVVVPGWYTDEALTLEWDFDTQRMPLGNLALYTRSLPVFETEEYVPQAPEGEESPEAGVRVTGYNGGETDIIIPETIDGLTVYAVNAGAFPAGCSVSLPGCLAEIDAESFAQANITLYAPACSATEQLLQAAGCTVNAIHHTLSFQANGGILIDPVSVPAGEAVELPGCIRDGSVLEGWFTDEQLTVPAGASGDTYIMPDADTVLYAAWDSPVPEYAFLWEQRGDTVAVTGSRQAAYVEIPAQINGLPVTVVDAYAFSDDTALTDLVLPEGLAEIGEFAFYGTGLRTVALPDTVTSVGRYAFASCGQMEEFIWSASASGFSAGLLSGNSELRTVSLAEGITSVGAFALQGCSALTTLTVPDSVQSIGEGALSDMTGLKTLAIGRNVVSISPDALDGCSALETIGVQNGNTHYVSVDGVLYYTDRAGIVRYPAGAARTAYTVDPAAIMIESHAFAGAGNLEDIVLPGGIVQIGTEAFAGSGLTGIDLSSLAELTALPDGAFDNCQALSEVLLPAGLVSIGREAFSRCHALLILDIPDSVNRIGSNAFSEEVTLLVGDGTEGRNYAQNNGLAFRLRNQAVIPALAITAEKTELTLLTGKRYMLSAAVSPADTTDRIQWFSGDSGILRVDDGEIRPLKAGETVLTVVAGDAELTLPVTVIDHSIRIDQGPALLYSGSTLQLTARSVADNAVSAEFEWDCDGGSISAEGLFSVTRTGMATVTVLDDRGVSDSLTLACVMGNDVMTLPSALKTVEDEAFRGDSTVHGILLPSGVTGIGDYAFADCSGLRLVLIPGNVSSISRTAFENSPQVTIVCAEGSSAAVYAEEEQISCWILP